MNDLDNILEKYFNGISTAKEEQILKEYFGSAAVSPKHEIYKPLFAHFDREKQIKAPAVSLPHKKSNKHSLLRRSILLAVGSAAVALMAITLSIHQREQPQHTEYVVIVNGKHVTNPHKAQQYAKEMFSEAEKIVESSYQPFREATILKEELNAEKIIRETGKRIESIKSNHQ